MHNGINFQLLIPDHFLFDFLYLLLLSLFQLSDLIFASLFDVIQIFLIVSLFLLDQLIQLPYILLQLCDLYLIFKLHLLNFLKHLLFDFCSPIPIILLDQIFALFSHFIYLIRPVLVLLRQFGSQLPDCGVQIIFLMICLHEQVCLLLCEVFLHFLHLEYSISQLNLQLSHLLGRRSLPTVLFVRKRSQSNLVSHLVINYIQQSYQQINYLIQKESIINIAHINYLQYFNDSNATRKINLSMFQICYYLQLLFFRNFNLMSDEQEQMENQQEEEEEEEENQEQDQQENEEGEDDQDQEEEEEDQDGEEEDDEGQQEEEDKQNDEESKAIPSFKPVSQEFVFKNLIAQIASIGNSVDHFINSLPSRGGSAYRSYQPRIQYDFKARTADSLPPVQQKKYTIMKDEDIQVSMQPQIVIQQTLTPKQQPKKQPYRISNESTKFLAQLYEQNKKLKRWQNTQTGALTNTWSKSKQKFERPEHERGLINLDDRNREIDEAIQMLRKQDYQNQQ